MRSGLGRAVRRRWLTPGNWMDAAGAPYPAILWEDESLVVVNKPAGVLSLPDGYDPQVPHLAQILASQFGRLWIVHRLDRFTSGVLVLARSAQAHHLLNDQFAGRQVQKIYHALSAGSPDWTETEIALPLRKNGDRQHRTVVDPRQGKPAVTQVRVLERFAGISLIEAHPLTGYTHQIRAHLASVGSPILSDPLYGGPLDPLIGRTALHALSIRFFHPITGQPLSLSASYPADFQAALEKLRQEAGQPRS